MGAKPSSYEVLSVPAHTGKARGRSSTFPESALKQLQENEEYKSISQLFQFPGSEEYKGNSYQWNWDSIGAPLAFFVPRTEEDISSFFRYYNAQADLKKYSISIAAGRHSNMAIMTDALVIDMKAFKKADIDAEQKIGRFGAGLKLGAFDEATYKYGLATPAGTNPDTGLTGLLLGGGFGFLSRRHGTTADNLIAARVVLPNGEIVAATEDNQHKDLLWGLRGGGGNFGVVTELTIRLHPQGDVYSGACVYFMREAGLFTIGFRAILQQWRHFAAKAPNELNCMCVLLGNGILALPYQYTAVDLAEGERLLVDAKKIGNPFVKLFGVVPYAGGPNSLQWQGLKDQQAGNYYEMGLFLREVSDGAIDVLLKYSSAATLPNKKCNIVLAPLGGKMNEFGEDHSPLRTRNAAFWIIVFGVWDSAADSAEYARRRAAVKSWVLNLKKDLAPFLVEGTYNTLSSEEAEQKERENMERKDGQVQSVKIDYLWNIPEVSGPVRKRLVELKRKCDPYNVLRNNKNIDPNESI